MSQAYGSKEAVTDELVDCILKPGLLPGAVDVFLDFISYSGGPVSVCLHVCFNPALLLSDPVCDTRDRHSAYTHHQTLWRACIWHSLAPPLLPLTFKRCIHHAVAGRAAHRDRIKVSAGKHPVGRGRSLGGHQPRATVLCGSAIGAGAINNTVVSLINACAYGSSAPEQSL